MARPKKARPTIAAVFYSEHDRQYHGFANLGTKPDGRPWRRHCQATTRADCEVKVRAAEEQAARGRVPKASRTPTLAEWLVTWLDEVVVDLAYATRQTYRWAVEQHLIPGLGGWRLALLEADSTPIGDFYRRLAETTSLRGKPLASSSVHTVHRVLRAALNEARHRGLVTADLMESVRAPKLDEEEITPLYIEEVKRILAVCERRRNGTRWSVGMPLGLRQGEALGLPWMQPSTSVRDKPAGLDSETGWLVVRTKAQRHKWEHGCKDPHACALKHCHGPCQPPWEHGCPDPAKCRKQAWRCPRRRPGQCRQHKRACPSPCPPDCTGHARVCPQRTGGGIRLDEGTKSRAGRRRMALSLPMVGRIQAHRQAQDAERDAAMDLWEEHGLVWCTPLGKPIDAKADWNDWKALLREAGVRDARVHDGRHTAATLLLLQGIEPGVVMEIMGWSDRRMLDRYQHVVDDLRKDAAKKIGALLWPGEPVEPATPQQPEFSPGSATDLATDHGAKIIPFRRRTA